MKTEESKTVETFKTINGFDGKYSISNHGRVLSCKKVKPKFMRQKFGRMGDAIVVLYNEKRFENYVLSLIIEQFLPKPKDFSSMAYVKYIDGDRGNNRLENLIWTEGH